MPCELPASAWLFDPARWPDRDDCVAVGADMAPGTILGAYASGAFPMPGADRAPMLWWSPVRRGVLELAELRVSRSLRQARARFEIRVDSAFTAVITACADPTRAGAWINQEILDCYCELHHLGWAHSVEAWTHDGELAGGLYGIAIGGLFAGESMFHHHPAASKVALCGLFDVLCDEYADERLIDVQWQTPHLASLGAREIDRDVYLERLTALLDVPLPARWA